MDSGNEEGLARRNSTFTYKASEESTRPEFRHETAAAQDEDPLLSDEEQSPRQGFSESNSLRIQSKGLTELPAWSTILLTLLILGLILFFQAFSYYANLLLRSHEHTTHDQAVGMLGIPCHPGEHIHRKATTLNYNFTVSAAFERPDGVKKRVYLVNGAFPGPTIECRAGDTLSIHVTNAISDGEGISLHWHGLEMRNANQMDGAIGFTQAPIPVGSTFTYEFQIDQNQSGTFWWHAHSQVQRGDGLYGGLIVHQPVVNQTEPRPSEALLLVGDWYHRTAQDVLAWFTSAAAIGNEPVPDSILINGKGIFDCSMAVTARPVECSSVESNHFLPIFDRHAREGNVRLRIVNAGSLAGFTLKFSGAKVKPLAADGDNPIEADGHYNSVGVIYPGERVDLLLEWTGASILPPKVEIQLDPENFRLPNPALSPNQDFVLLKPAIVSRTNRVIARSLDRHHLRLEQQNEEPVHFDLESATGITYGSAAFELPEPSQEPIVVYTKTEKLARLSYHPKSFINRTSWSPQTDSDTGLRQPLISLPRHQWDRNQLVPYIALPLTVDSNETMAGTGKNGTCIDIIINNLDDGAHPFHLHGHSFWVLRSYRAEDRSWGSFNPYSSTPPDSDHASHFRLNTRTPIRKDTISVPRRGHVVLRLWTDNPGIWMLHCHVLVHQASGMAMGLQIGGDLDSTRGLSF
ncbi:uncharacterized protein A1O9_07911 [Exophiala aquamarina CBS 119918]|uniref:L-ascorbate oxidase n=1 Tax=Exophiala aquamarina CBS 119918 TaxID=1182545 RepID=A0A072PLF3_9EURO|nr:uncharacterized protein A1O9_07911 [Exophiala aquamarina CBS 119918]KEF56330.1 hypothetical protein A1O9_07911 [Exophiala aquamarina CBS 119918]